LIILHGVYSLGKKIVAYRNGFCLTCAVPRRIYGLRAFRFFHLFYVPLIPLGFGRIWRCSVCHFDPRENAAVEVGWAWFGSVLFGIMSVTGWFDAQPDPRKVWGILLSIWLIFLFLLWRAVFITRRYRSVAMLNRGDKQSFIKMANENICPFCGTMLMVGDHPICPQCGVERVY
jgi:hypothetical protein